MSRHVHNSFPDDFATNEEKESPEYGLQVAKGIDSQWFENGQLNHRRRWIDEMRAYSRGEQTTDYKKMIEGDAQKPEKGKQSFKSYKIDYSETIRVMPVFKDIVTNAIDESLFKPRAEAIDITAVNKKKDYFEKIEEDFYTADFARIISEGINVDISPKNLPKNNRELEIKKLEYKPRIEIAQELAIENVLKHQKFEAVKDKIDEDLFDLGIGVAWHHTDQREGIKVKYVDPYYFIHNPFQIDDGRDLRYKGEVKRGTIGELIDMSSRNLSEDELLSLKNLSMGQKESTEPYNEEPDSHRLIEYIVFEYQIEKSRIFKKYRKNQSVKLIDRTNGGYSPSNKKRKIEIPYNISYEGVYVPSAQILLKWEPIPNQVEKETNSPISNYVVFAPKVKRISEKGHIRFDSLVQRAKPIIDDIHRDWYKFQQLKMELRPNSVTISPKALNRVMLNGEKIPAETLINLFFGRGLLLADETDEDGEPIGRAIREENGGVNNSAIVLLANEFLNNYNRLRQLLGINELRDGTTTPNSKTAVTVQKLLLASSNNATNHIVKASFNISLRIAETISYRLYDVLTTKALKDRYLNIIGSDNVALLDAIKELPAHKFAIYFDFKPDNEERIVFERSLIDSYNQKELNIAQYNKARQIRNTKSALKYLEFAIEENFKKTEEQKLRNIEAQARANAQATVIAEQTKQQTITIEFEKERNLELLKSKLNDESERKRAFTRELLAQREHQRQMELKSIEVSGMMEREEKKEDRRDQRVRQQSKDQAVLVEKRKDPSKQVVFDEIESNSKSLQEELSEIFKPNGLPTTEEV